jgi:phosphoadenosine phosphosulfate reductase
VAFSGEKDSIVLLDLVQRALSPDEFAVIFADTDMEIDSTYSVIKKAHGKWDKLRFYIAKLHYLPEETWRVWTTELDSQMVL